MKQFIVILCALCIASSINLVPFIDLFAVDDVCFTDFMDSETESHDCSIEVDFEKVVHVISHHDMLLSFNREKLGEETFSGLPNTIFLSIFSPPPEIDS